MPQAIRRLPLTLNTDGQPHPKENSLAGATLVLGLLAFISSFFHDLHLLSAWAGLIGIVTGAWGQYISATTAERFLLVIGLVGSGVGFGIALAHGGPFGGVW
jgi:hypothetical protein